MRIVLMTLVVALAFSGCATTEDPDVAGSPSPATSSPSPTTEPSPGADCSASELSEDLPEPDGLPDAVAMMRKEILKAAVQCDYELLEQLAKNGSPDFSYSFGEATSGDQARPGAYWRRAEENGDEVLAELVRVLGEPYGTQEVEGTTHYVFPEQAVTSDQYLDYRAGITEEGDWIFFVAGD